MEELQKRIINIERILGERYGLNEKNRLDEIDDEIKGIDLAYGLEVRQLTRRFIKLGKAITTLNKRFDKNEKDLEGHKYKTDEALMELYAEPKKSLSVSSLLNWFK